MVDVVSSNLIARSNNAQVVELVDTILWGGIGESRASSSLVLGTIFSAVVIAGIAENPAERNNTRRDLVWLTDISQGKLSGMLWNMPDFLHLYLGHSDNK